MKTGLDGRSQNENGRTRAKNGNTKLETLRETYGENLAKGTRADAKLSTVLKKTGAPSLRKLVRKK